MGIYNTDRQRWVVKALEAAKGVRTRTRGLIGHQPLQAEQGMMIDPCRWIHTFGMPGILPDLPGNQLWEDHLPVAERIKKFLDHDLLEYPEQSGGLRTMYPLPPACTPFEPALFLHLFCGVFRKPVNLFLAFPQKAPVFCLAPIGLGCDLIFHQCQYPVRYAICGPGKS